MIKGVSRRLQSTRAPGAREEYAASLHAGTADVQEFLERIVNSIADPVFVKDREHCWIFINDAFCRLMGRSRESLLGKSDFDFFSRNESLVFYEKDERVFSTGEENINEEALTDLQGVTHIVVTKKMLLKDKDDRSFIVGVIRDVSDQKKVEDELRTLNATLEARVAERSAVAEARSAALAVSNGELMRFAYVASHDLQEPLHSVASYIQLLERRCRDQLDATAHDFIRNAIDGIARMRRLIKDLLEYSQLARAVDDRQPTSSDQVLRQVVFLLRQKIEETHASIKWSRLPMVQSNPSRLAQIFQNLISNAIKFRSSLRPHVQISAKRDGALWVFSVRDNGIGIDPGYSERIFDVFQRLHSTDEYPGTGIGLAICRRIVERYGGRIWAESIPDHGTTFYFTLPNVETGKADSATKR